jgi:hypothetical protein
MLTLAGAVADGEVAPIAGMIGKCFEARSRLKNIRENSEL